MISLSFYQLKQVGSDYILLTDDTADVRITFADRPADAGDLVPTKEEQAALFTRVKCMIGLEGPVMSLQQPMKINIFLDHHVDLFGTLRSVPFPFHVARIDLD
jgi:hypothetical protein